MIDKLKIFSLGFVSCLIICLISYAVYVYYGDIHDKQDIKQLNKEAESAVKDSLDFYHWDSISVERKAELLEQWSRKK